MKKESIRKLSIALAAILGLGALLYLSGLVAQLLINYEDWLHSGGMTGTAQIAPLQYHPLYCIRHAFTPAGLRAALLILTVGSGVFLFLRLRDRFGGKDLDDRNFVRSKRPKSERRRSWRRPAQRRHAASYWAGKRMVMSSASRKTHGTTSTWSSTAPAAP